MSESDEEGIHSAEVEKAITEYYETLKRKSELNNDEQEKRRRRRRRVHTPMLPTADVTDKSDIVTSISGDNANIPNAPEPDDTIEQTNESSDNTTED